MLPCKTLINAIIISALLAVAPAHAQEEKPEPVRISFGGGPTGSSVYAIAAALATMIENTVPGSAVTTIEGGTVSNAIRVAQGQVQIAYTKPATAYSAQKGTEKPFTEPSDQILGMFGLTSAPVHIAIDKEYGFQSFADVVTNKAPVAIGGGAIGDSAEIFLRRILGYYDLTYDDIRAWGGEIRNVPLGEGLAAFKDGQIDMQITPDTLPHSGILELSQARNVQLLSLDDQLITDLSQEFGYSRATIPAGTYAGTDYDVTTLDDPFILTVNAELSDDFVYWFTKAVMSEKGRKLLGAINPQLAEVTPEESFAMLGEVRLHPGAERYWREAGVLKD